MKGITQIIQHIKIAYLNSTSQIQDTPGNREMKILNHFKSQSGFRPELVYDVSHNITPISIELSEQELIATICLLLSHRPFHQAINQLLLWSEEGWNTKFDSDFFQLLERTSLELNLKGMHHIARDLLKIGEILAKTRRDRELAALFQDQIEHNNAARIRDLPYLKQRGW
jgi:hypothetical protein